MPNITYCAFCGKEMDYDEELFRQGKTGEPVCEKCREQEEQVKNSG